MMKIGSWNKIQICKIDTVLQIVLENINLFRITEPLTFKAVLYTTSDFTLALKILISTLAKLEAVWKSFINIFYFQ